MLLRNRRRNEPLSTKKRRDMSCTPLVPVQRNQLVDPVAPHTELKRVDKHCTCPVGLRPRRSIVKSSRSRSSSYNCSSQTSLCDRECDRERPEARSKTPIICGKQSTDISGINFVPADELMDNPLRDSELPYKIDFLTFTCEDEENDAVSEVSLDDCLQTQEERIAGERKTLHDGLLLKTFQDEMFINTIPRAPRTRSQPISERSDSPSVNLPMLHVQTNEKWGMTIRHLEGEAPSWMPLDGHWPSDEDKSPIKGKRLVSCGKENKIIIDDPVSEEQSTEVQILELPGELSTRFSQSFEI
ncbi:hypothetical protein ACA910_020723 [Epithemia clementina (nom. ined.)]